LDLLVFKDQTGHSIGVLEYWSVRKASRGGVYPLQELPQRPIYLRFSGNLAMSKSQAALKGGDKPRHYKNWKFFLLGSLLSPNDTKISYCRVGCAHQIALNLTVISKVQDQILFHLNR